MFDIYVFVLAILVSVTAAVVGLGAAIYLLAAGNSTPILDVDQAKNIIYVKRSTGPATPESPTNSTPIRKPG
jgi:hypothetical protein